jgi:hypothetical protein
MNKKRLLLAGISFLTVWVTTVAYVSEDTWRKAQHEGLLPEVQRQKLDTFFHEHADVAALFTQEKYTVPAAWHGTLDPKSAEKGGWRQTRKGGFEYRTTPNTQFPGTFDATQQLWVDRPLIEFFEVTPEQEKERRKNRAKIYDFIQDVLVPLNLKNETEWGGNIIVSLTPYDIPYVVHGTWRAWTTYPQVASRYFTARGVQKRLHDQNFQKIQVPNHYLYHVPGRLHDLTDSNWLVVSDALRNQLSVSEMRKAFIRMNIIYLLVDTESSVKVTEEQMKTILDEIGTTNPDSCLGVCYQTICDLQDHAVSEQEKEDACACIREMHRFLHPEEGFLWKPLVQWDKDVVNDAGDPTIKETAIALVRNDDGTHTIYLTDFEMPSIAGPKVDEERCMKFTGEADGLLTFAKYLQGDVLESWDFLTTVE